MMKTLVLGMGNTIRKDDGVGVIAVRALRGQIDHPDVDIKETEEAGFGMLDLFQGYDEMIIVDAIKTGQARPGTVHCCGPEVLNRAGVQFSSHQTGLPTVLEMANLLNIESPRRIHVFAVEVRDTDTFGDTLSDEVREASQRVTNLVKRHLVRQIEIHSTNGEV